MSSLPSPTDPPVLYFLFSQPLSSNDDFLNLLNIQGEQQTITYSALESQASLKFRIATGTRTNLRDAIYDFATVLHLSCHVTKDRKHLHFEQNHLEADSVDAKELCEILDETSENARDRPATSIATSTKQELDSAPLTPDDAAASQASPAPDDGYSSETEEDFVLPPPDMISASAAAQLPFKIVVLNACYSQSFAEVFLSRGVKHVVCYSAQHPLDDKEALTFSSTFYTYLLAGKPVRYAFNRAREAVTDLFPHEKRLRYQLLPHNGHHEDVYFLPPRIKGERKAVREIILPFPRPFNNRRDEPIAIGCIDAVKSVIEALRTTRLSVIMLTGERGVGKTRVAQVVAQMLHQRCLVNEVYRIDVRRIIECLAEEYSSSARRGQIPSFLMLGPLIEEQLLLQLSASLQSVGIKVTTMDEAVRLITNPEAFLLEKTNNTSDKGSSSIAKFESVADSLLFQEAIRHMAKKSVYPLIVFEHASDMAQLSELIPDSAISSMMRPFRDLINRTKSNATVIIAGNMPKMDEFDMPKIDVKPPHPDLSAKILVWLYTTTEMTKLAMKFAGFDPTRGQNAMNALVKYLQDHPLKWQFAASPLVAKTMQALLSRHNTIDAAWDALRKSPPRISILDNDAIQAMRERITQTAPLPQLQQELSQGPLLLTMSNTSSVSVSSPTTPQSRMETQTFGIPSLSLQSSQSALSTAYSDPFNPRVSGDNTCADVMTLSSLTTRQEKFEAYIESLLSIHSQSNTPNPYSQSSPPATNAAAQGAFATLPSNLLPSITAPSTRVPIPVLQSLSQGGSSSHSQNAWTAPRSALSPESPDVPTPTASASTPAPSSTVPIPSAAAHSQERRVPPVVPPRRRAVSELSVDSSISVGSDSRANGKPAVPELSSDAALEVSASLHTSGAKQHGRPPTVAEVDPVNMFYMQLQAASTQVQEKRKLVLNSSRDLPHLSSVLAERMSLIKRAIENVPEFPLSAISPVVLWKVFERANPVAERCIPLMLRFIQDMFFAIMRTYDTLESAVGYVDSKNAYASFSLSKHLQQLFDWSEFALMEQVPGMPITGSDAPEIGDIPLGWNKGWERLGLLAARLSLVRSEWEQGQVWLCNRNMLRDQLFTLNKDGHFSDGYGIRVDPVSMQLTIGWCARTIDVANKPALRFNDVELIPLPAGGFTTSSRVPAVHNLKLRSVQELLDKLGLRVHINNVRRV